MTTAQTHRLLADAGVVATIDGPILRVILDHPAKHNAQSPQTWEALAALGDDLPESTRVVILSGNGPSFSAGLDRAMFGPPQPGRPSLAALATVSAEECDAAIAGYQRAFLWWRSRRPVTIAAVHGHAIGAGFQLALACDLMVVAESASLSMKEVALGLVPDLGGTLPLVEAVGTQRALEMCLTGRAVTGAEAVESGMALACVPDADLESAVADLTAAILAAPPNATAEVLALLRGARGRTHGEQALAERTAQRRRILELAELMRG